MGFLFGLGEEMGLETLIFQVLLRFNRFLFEWSRVNKLPNNRSKKQYDIVLQEFILVKTQYKVLTNILRKKSSNIELRELPERDILV